MFTDIPTCLWWAITILATHGSAFSATTALGKVVSGLTMLTGVALFSILTNVIGRSLLATLFGDDSEEAPPPEARAGSDRFSGLLSEEVVGIVSLPASMTASAVPVCGNYSSESQFRQQSP